MLFVLFVCFVSVVERQLCWPQCVYRDQRITFGSRFSPSTMLVPRSSALATSSFIH